MRGPVALLMLLLSFGCSMPQLSSDPEAAPADGKGEGGEANTQESPFDFPLPEVNCEDAPSAQGVLTTGWFTTQAPGRYDETEWKTELCDKFCGSAPEGTASPRIDACKEACMRRWEALAEESTDDVWNEPPQIRFRVNSVDSHYAISMVVRPDLDGPEDRLQERAEGEVIPMDYAVHPFAYEGKADAGQAGFNIARACFSPQPSKEATEAIDPNPNLDWSNAHGLFLITVKGDVSTQVFHPGRAYLSATPPLTAEGLPRAGEFFYEVRYDCGGCLVM